MIPILPTPDVNRLSAKKVFLREPFHVSR